MKHVWSVLCYKGIIDRATSQISLIDAIDALTFFDAVGPDGEHSADQLMAAVAEQGKVLVPVAMQLLTQVTRSMPDEPEAAQLEVLIRSPAGKVLGSSRHQMDLTETVRGRHTLNFKDFPFSGEGTYRLAVRMKGESDQRWRKVADIPVEFHIKKPEDT